MKPEDGATGMFGLERRQVRIALVAVIAFKLVILFVFAWNCRLVMDEFAQVGYAKYLGNGLFDTVQPPKAVGFAVFYQLSHLIGWDAESILRLGRIQTALLACATIAIVYACARALGEDKARALLIVLILLCFSNFIERIFRTRAEPLALFFAAAALLVVLRGGTHKAQTVLAAGILSGLAFLSTQKAVYFNVALGVALVADAAMARRYVDGIARGAWLVLGWLAAIIAYCFIFGGSDPLHVAESLLFGPVEVATRGGAEYGGLRRYVVQTLLRNAVLYSFCFGGMVVALLQIARLDERRRIALVFTIVISALVFAHDQPWPYVFVMALPFMSLWSLTLLDFIATNTRYLRHTWVALTTVVIISCVNNIAYLRTDNVAQLELVTRAESLLAPDEQYFDGIGMLPNRPEPTTLWLDKFYILKTLREGKNSEAYKVLENSPPKIILWSYRMDAVFPVVAPLIRDSYIKVAPNLRIAGRRLYPGQQQVFDVPISGKYGLYSEAGTPLQGQVEIDGAVFDSPFHFVTGSNFVTLRTGSDVALLLPEGSYAGYFKAGSDNEFLFANVYN